MSWLDRLKGKGADEAQTPEDRPMPDRSTAPEGVEPALPPAEATTTASAAEPVPALEIPAPPPPWPPAEEEMRSALVAAQKGDYDTALSIWEPLAREGHGRAQNNIGACFIDGLGVEQNLELAREWLELSADSGDPVGQRNLARLCLKGLGGAQDTTRALELYRLASEAGDAPAQEMLSFLLFEGTSVPSDPAESKRWATAAAAQGIGSAMTRLGLMAHLDAVSAAPTAPDDSEAANWWRKAAEAGDPDGQALLGAAHHLGAGVPRDRVAAFAWLLRAKAGNSPLADRFFDAVRATLSPEEEAAAERRVSMAEEGPTPAP
ncbi:tetratricopeptide repeat protein [Xanthobacter agilis]|uniref:TPR repeat protein n=2 Tax=Xanthobacter agilis TaxID=47492 RepID=A0ABU0LA93_XANAG|nr:tetratricopeptide repeat protein [Xanthobacter agilis]MDQ0504044.1 TPR repeat protein [Xanthobacter agilis]